jgi:sugar phosphate isomerase/epimerase
LKVGGSFMSDASFTISAFGDEIAQDLETQLEVLRDLDVGCLELRAAWGKNVLRLDDEEVSRVRELCLAYGITVASIGSPIGKSPLQDPLTAEEENLARAFEIGETVGTRCIRVFSFYPPDTSTNAHYDQHVEEAAQRLGRLTDLASGAGFTLMLENERDIVGDNMERCHKLICAVDSPHLRFLWDPANFVLIGVERPTETGWDMLGDHISYVHVKDARLSDQSIHPAGEGEGQVPELLERLARRGYQGVLALEPHLAIAGHSSGFSGPEGMAVAVTALRRLLDGVPGV